MSKMKVSIVIPTLNGGEDFKRCLAAIFSQNVIFPFEVLVIDSGSTDETVSIAREFPVRLYQIAKKEFNHGLTRNMGIELSKGEFVVLMTQDAIPANKNWLSSLVSPFFKDERVAGVYARQIPREDANVLTKRRHSRWLTSRMERDVKFITDRASYEKLLPMQRYMFCNFDDVCSCIRKSVWEKIPLEKTIFADDLEWSKKVFESGFKIVYEPSASVIHSHNRSVLYEYKRVYINYRRLNEIFGVQTAPTLGHVVLFTFRDTVMDILYVLGKEHNIPKMISLLTKVPLLSFVRAYARYKGAKDQIERQELKQLSGI